MSRAYISRAALSVVGLLLLAGCGGDRPGYDDAAVESYLSTSQANTFGKAGEVGKATCPGDLLLREGMTFVCKLDVSGAKLAYKVRLTNVHGEKVSVSAAPDGVLVSGTRLNNFLRSSLPKASAAAKVDCGGAFVVADVGESLPCTMTLGAQEKAVKVTVKDKTGRVSIGS